MSILNVYSVIDGEMGTYRNCGLKLPETCSIVDVAGTNVTACNCQTDNCNKDNQCDCSSSTTIGISAVSLLISAFVLLEMK